MIHCSPPTHSPIPQSTSYCFRVLHCTVLYSTNGFICCYWCAGTVGYKFPDGVFAASRGVRPPPVNRPGGMQIFLSTIERHRRCHATYGNSTSSDEEWRPSRIRGRIHQKKQKRGQRGLGARNFQSSPLPNSPLPQRTRRRVFVSNVTKLRAVEEYDVLLERGNFHQNHLVWRGRLL